MPRLNIADQIECLEDLESEAANSGRPARAALIAAAIRTLKQADYQRLEAKRKARREQKLLTEIATVAND